MPDGLYAEVEEHLRMVQTRMGKTFGDAQDPPRCSGSRCCRSIASARRRTPPWA